MCVRVLQDVLEFCKKVILLSKAFVAYYQLLYQLQQLNSSSQKGQKRVKSKKKMWLIETDRCGWEIYPDEGAHVVGELLHANYPTEHFHNFRSIQSTSPHFSKLHNNLQV